MKPIALADGGPALSPIVAGAWRMAGWGWSAPERPRWIEQCPELGVTSFDHADLYGDYAVESLFGEALALAPGLRDRLQLVSKCGIKLVSAARPAHRIKHYETSAAHIRASVERSLAALRTDRLDLLLIHRPDPLMHADEVACTFEALQREGKVLHFGVSNFKPSQFELLASRTRLVTNQVELHPLHMDALGDGTLDLMQRLRLRPMIWSPLAGGALVTGGDERAQRVRATLESLAAARGVAPATIAYAWLMRHPSAPVPVTGSRRVEAIRDAVAALAVRLDVQEWTAIWQSATGHEVA